MKRKIILIGFALLLLLSGVGVSLYFYLTPSAPPQIITLPNGEQYQFYGTTYSTKAVPPYFPARITSWLPQKFVLSNRRFLSPQAVWLMRGQMFQSPRLFVWFRRLGANAPVIGGGRPLDAMLADESGIVSGEKATTFFTSSPWNFLSFPVVPRRSRTITCNFYLQNYATVASNYVAQVSFPNPLYGEFPQWQAEPVPAVKTNGDLQVHLNDVNMPAFGSYNAYDWIKQPQFDIQIDSGMFEPVKWIIATEELCDATGNTLTGRAHYHRNSFRLPIPGMLWPGESAWKLRLGIKPVVCETNEIVTFTNMPVLGTNSTNMEEVSTLWKGKEIDLKWVRYPVFSGFTAGGSVKETMLRFSMDGFPKDITIELNNVTTDKGDEIENVIEGSSETEKIIWLPHINTNVQSINITLKVQKLRFVEFLVKPPKPE